MATRPVIVRTHRGVGNQLFQFAAGFALARRLGVLLRFDGGWTPQPVLGPCLGDRWVAATPRQLWSGGSLRTPPLLAQASRARRLRSRMVGRTRGRSTRSPPWSATKSA